jgi:sulfur-oxidizing protein SoxY
MWMSMNMKRRLFLRGSVAAGVAIGASVLIPGQLLAAWPKEAFEAKEMGAALTSLLGGADAADSADIEVKAPEIAENGAVVPVTVSSSISDVESISILAAKNPVPLVASFMMGPGAVAYASTRIKMGATGDVVGVVKAGGKLYKASREVKVTIGGCGG